MSQIYQHTIKFISCLSKKDVFDMVENQTKQMFQLSNNDENNQSLELKDCNNISYYEDNDIFETNQIDMKLRDGILNNFNIPSAILSNDDKDIIVIKDNKNRVKMVDENFSDCPIKKPKIEFKKMNSIEIEKNAKVITSENSEINLCNQTVPNTALFESLNTYQDLAFDGRNCTFIKNTNIPNLNHNQIISKKNLPEISLEANIHNQVVLNNTNIVKKNKLGRPKYKKTEAADKRKFGNSEVNIESPSYIKKRLKNTESVRKSRRNKNNPSSQDYFKCPKCGGDFIGTKGFNKHNATNPQCKSN